MDSRGALREEPGMKHHKQRGAESLRRPPAHPEEQVAQQEDSLAAVGHLHLSHSDANARRGRQAHAPLVARARPPAGRVPGCHSLRARVCKEECWDSGPAVVVVTLDGLLGCGGDRRGAGSACSLLRHSTTPAYSQLGPHMPAGSCRLLGLSQQKGPGSKQGLTQSIG